MNDRHWFGLNAGKSSWLWLSLILIALDQYTKYLITENMAEFDSVTLLPFLDFVRLHNEGAAFSFLSEASGWQRWLFIGTGLIVSSAIVVWLRRLPAKGHHLLASGLAFILGGAIGNVMDRVLWGHVVDFIRVYLWGWPFPAFNIADSAISIGAALLIVDSLIDFGRASTDTKPAVSSEPDSDADSETETETDVGAKAEPEQPRAVSDGGQD